MKNDVHEELPLFIQVLHHHPPSVASSTRQFMKLSSPLWLLSSSYTSYQMWDSLSFRRIELIFQGEVWLVVGRWQAVTVFVQVRIFQQSKWFWRKENIWGYQILLRTSHSQSVTLNLSGPWGRGHKYLWNFPPTPWSTTPSRYFVLPLPWLISHSRLLLINFPAPILLSAKVGHTRPARQSFKCTSVHVLIAKCYNNVILNLVASHIVRCHVLAVYLTRLRLLRKTWRYKWPVQ